MNKKWNSQRIFLIITDFQIRDINPLAVNVVVVNILTPSTDPLLSIVLTVIARLPSSTLVVLQTEGGLEVVEVEGRVLMDDWFVLPCDPPPFSSQTNQIFQNVKMSPLNENAGNIRIIIFSSH